MHVHVPVFYLICSLTYFHIKIFVRDKKKICYLHFSWTQTILPVEKININRVANLFVLEKPKIPKRYSGSRHLDGAFCKNSWWLKVINYFCKKVHLRFSNGLWIRPCILLPRNFLCTFRKWSFTEKMLRKFRNEFLQMYGET